VGPAVTGTASTSARARAGALDATVNEIDTGGLLEVGAERRGAAEAPTLGSVVAVTGGPRGRLPIPGRPPERS
jgi:hypothetical protein